MSQPVRLPKWPFLLGDGLLVATAAWLATHAQGESPAIYLAIAGCVALGAYFAIRPFVLEYQRSADLVQGAELSSAMDKIQDLEKVAAQIGAATGQWQIAQENAVKVNDSAKQIADFVTSEAKQFQEFLQKANDTEKASLRLEVEKLHRAEGEWLQVSVRILDNIYALYSAAVQSGQENLIREVTAFQNACRETTRRVGLMGFVAPVGQPFDAQSQQLAEGAPEPAADAVVTGTVVTGFTFQGQLIRKALVVVGTPAPAEAETTAAQAPSGEVDEAFDPKAVRSPGAPQNELPL